MIIHYHYTLSVKMKRSEREQRNKTRREEPFDDEEFKGLARWRYSRRGRVQGAVRENVS